MPDQAKVNPAKPRPVRRLKRNLGSLLHDVIELGELQTQLLRVDLTESAQSLVRPLVLAACGLSLLLGTVPVLLFGCSMLLDQATTLSLGPCLVVVSLVAFVLAALFGYASYLTARGSLSALKRSGAELRENMAWLKFALSSADETDANGYEAPKRF